MDNPRFENNPKPSPHPGISESDPYVYASVLNSLVTDRNPFQVLVGDISRRVKMALQLKKTRQLAQERIDHLQQQVDKVEHCIESTRSQTTGGRINKLR